MARRRRLGATVLLVAGAASTALVLALWLAGALEPAELDAVDARFSIRGAHPSPSDVVVVAIDDATFQETGEQWPFPRSMHGRVIDRLRESGAAAIAYDVQFTEPSERREDDALIREVRRAGERVVLGTSEVNEFGESAVLGGIDVPSANFLVPASRDGVNRRLPHSIDGLETLAVAVVEAADGRRVDPDPFGDEGAWIDFRGPPGTIRTVSFSRVLDGSAAAALFRDRIVVVGATTPSLQDLHPTSVGGLMSGPEIQANAVWTVRAGLPLRSLPGAVDVLLILAFGLLHPLAALRRRPLVALAASAAAVVAYLPLAYFAFAGPGLILPVAAPLAACAVSLIATLGVSFATAALERERTRAIFARFVPEDVVEEVLSAANGDLRLAGRRVQCTVVFCDLRSFTPWAELLPAEQVLEVLNRYSGEMTATVEEHGGTVVSLRGDGVLAVFGAPVELPDHADRALAAVREMAGPRVEQLNDWIRERGLGDGFTLGIGVNSGIVMAGNVGSERRLEYTVIGDVTNTAARLEAMTKELECCVLVSDSTRSMLRGDASDLDYLDVVAVRGKQVKVGLWTLKHRPGEG